MEEEKEEEDRKKREVQWGGAGGPGGPHKPFGDTWILEWSAPGRVQGSHSFYP